MGGRTPADESAPARRCDGCDRPLTADATHCMACGISLESGRPLITSHGTSKQEQRENARRLLWLPSWPVFIGLAPVGSEAHVRKRTITTWTIAVVTALASVWFYVLILTDAPSQAVVNLMLWSGKPPPPSVAIDGEDIGDVEDVEEFPDGPPPEEAVEGEFRWYQPVTSMFLHGGLGHLVGNLIFLLIFGTRLNGLLGGPTLAVTYLLCGIGAALLHLAATVSGPRIAMLGASGAISGLAGMYLVFFPLQRMYIAAWTRPWFVGVPFLYVKLFPARGVYVVLCFTLVDVVSIMAGSEGDVAHWAHIGGFVTGALIAVAMLILRMVSSQGDLISAIFGRAAWPLLGRPADRAYSPGVEWGLLARLAGRSA